MVTIPTKAPKSLLPDAYSLYKRAYNYPYQVALKSDEERLAAADIVAAGLGRVSNYSGEETLSINRVSNSLVIADNQEPDLEAHPRMVAVISAGVRSERTVFAVLKGVDVHFENSNDLPTARIDVKHATGTDVEHDGAYIARLTLLSPVMNFINSGYTSFKGFLTESLLYPPGVDPTQVGDEYFEPGEVCQDAECYRGAGHPLMAFTPPESKIKNLPVEVDLYHELVLQAKGVK